MRDNRTADPVDGPTALIVDDEPDLRLAVELTLRQAGFHTLLARSGRDALDLLEQAHVSIVLLDILMPGEDGLMVLSQIRTRHPHLPVVMLTAVSTKTSVINALDLDADDYVQKPFGMLELPARLRAVLRRYEPARPARLHLIPCLLTWGDYRVRLSNGECDVLATLAAKWGTALTLEELTRHIRARDRAQPEIDARSVGRTRSSLARLRRKLGPLVDAILEETPRGHRCKLRIIIDTGTNESVA